MFHWLVAYVVFYSHIVLLCVHAALCGVIHDNDNNNDNDNESEFV